MSSIPGRACLQLPSGKLFSNNGSMNANPTVSITVMTNAMRMVTAMTAVTVVTAVTEATARCGADGASRTVAR